MAAIRWTKDSILGFINSHIVDYPTPVNLNYFWSFGSTAGICLVIQILTGVFFGSALYTTCRFCILMCRTYNA